MSAAPAEEIECPRCAAAPGSPCWRSYPAQALTGSATPVTPVPGYCQARHAAARGRAVYRSTLRRTENVTESL